MYACRPMSPECDRVRGVGAEAGVSQYRSPRASRHPFPFSKDSCWIYPSWISGWCIFWRSRSAPRREVQVGTRGTRAASLGLLYRCCSMTSPPSSPWASWTPTSPLEKPQFLYMEYIYCYLCCVSLHGGSSEGSHPKRKK